MGIKGSKLTNDAGNSAKFLIDQLNEIQGITSKKMFGGFGIFHDGKMFGIVDSKGKIFFKVNEHLEIKYKEKGSSKHSRMPYYNVPEEILDDTEILIQWAHDSIEESK